MQRRSWPVAIFGALLAVGGIVGTIRAIGDSRTFSQDETCTTKLVLRSTPHAGPACTIVDGTIGDVFTSINEHTSTTHVSTDHHIVVDGETGTVYDVVLQNEFWSPVYSRAKKGDAVALETLNGEPAFVATASGTVAGQGDPYSRLPITWIVIAAGGGLLYVAYRMHASVV